MANLLKETLDILKENNKRLSDILWFGTDKFSIDGDLLLLFDAEYDDGYSCNEVDLSLKVVGYDWWLERTEYDGSEWWEFKTMPTEPNKSQALISLQEK